MFGKISKKELLLYSVWACYLIAFLLLVMSEVAFDAPEQAKQIFDFIKFGCVLTFSVLAIKRYVDRNLFFMSLLIFGTLLLSCVYSRSLNFLLIFLSSFATVDCDFRKLVKLDLYVRCLITILLVGLSVSGIIMNYGLLINGNYKQALGFGHPNTFGLMLAVIIVELIYLYYNRIHFIGWLLLCFITYGLCKLGISRTALVLLALEIVFFLFLKLRWIQKIVFSKFGGGILIMFPTLICAGCYFMAEKFQRNHFLWMALDTLLTTRIYWASDYLKKYGVTAWGQSIAPMTSRNAILLGLDASNSFDMAYVRIGVQYGGVMLFFYIFILTMIQMKAYKEQNIGLLLANLFFILLGIVENLPFSIGMNVFLLSAFRFVGKKGAVN